MHQKALGWEASLNQPGSLSAPKGDPCRNRVSELGKAKYGSDGGRRTENGRKSDERGTDSSATFYFTIYPSLIVPVSPGQVDVLESQ